jgi:hypothetical protein
MSLASAAVACGVNLDSAPMSHIVSTMFVASTVAAGLVFATPGLAAAQPPATVSEAPPSACKGVNELRYIDLQAFYVKLNSCSTKEFADNLGNGKDVAGIRGGLA